MNRHLIGLEAIHTIAQVLAMPSGQREMLQEVLDILECQLGLCHGRIVLTNPNGEELVVEAARSGPPESPRQSRSPRSTPGVIRFFERERSPGEPAYEAAPPADAAGFRKSCCISVPITLGHETLGMLAVDLPHGPSVSLEAEDKLLGIIADMIAIEIKNCRLGQLDREALKAENQRLLTALKKQFHPENIIGHSRAMREVYTRIHQASGSEAAVIIRGESGTGKDLVASTIHYRGVRSECPFVRFNCAALGESLLAAELFGRGSGANGGERPGRIDEAEGGTLILDEIDRLPDSLQASLLHLLQEREFVRPGASQPRKANIRLIATTSLDLEAIARAGGFCRDLLDRLGHFAIFLPPLRERGSDILLLANCFVERYSRASGKKIRRISTPAINMLMAYHWPGNVRELEDTIEQALRQSADEVIHGYNLPPTLQMPDASEPLATGPLKKNVQAMECDMIVDALKRANGSISLASDELGITSRMVRYKIKLLNIDYRGIFRRKLQ